MLTRIREAHTYMTLTITYAPKQRLNLTMGYSGEKISGPADFDRTLMKRIFAAFRRVMASTVLPTNGERMRHVQCYATQATTLEEFCAALESPHACGAAYKA